MAWIALLAAGLLEIVWSAAMKQSNGFTNLRATLLMAASMLGSVALLSWAMRALPLGTAYMVWTGIGAVGAFVVGAALFGEALSPARILAAGVIIAGLGLMKMSGGA